MRLIFYAIKMKLFEIPYFKDLLHTTMLENRKILKML